MLIALTSLAFEIAAERARCLILKTEHELSVVGDASDKIGVAYFLIGRCEPSSDLSFFTTSRSTPHPLRILAGLSPRQGLGSRVRFANTSLSLIAYEMRSKMYCAWPPNRLGGCYIFSETRFLNVSIEIGRGFWFDNFFDFLDRPTRHFFRFFASTNANSDICLSVETLSLVQKALQLRFELPLPQ